MTFELRDATEEDCLAVALNMREADAAEVLASGGYTPKDAVLTSFGLSHETFAAVVDGEVLAVWGVAPLNILDGAAVVWMLTAKALEKWALFFLRKCRAEVRRLLQHWRVLLNAVDARYTKALRWAKWLGFEVLDPAPFGVAGLPFHVIVLRAPDV